MSDQVKKIDDQVEMISDQVVKTKKTVQKKADQDQIIANFIGDLEANLDALDGDTALSALMAKRGFGAAGFSASPVAGDGKIYCSSEQGEVHILAAGPAFNKLVVNRVEGSLMATPAISEGILYFRTLDSLIAVG